MSPVFIFVFVPGAAVALDIRGHKDELFALPKVLSRTPDGAYVAVDYQEMRDINGRDEVPERRVKRQYVDLSVRRHTQLGLFQGEGRRLDIGQTGKFEAARFAVIFVHGRGGDRRLGMDDYRFGGNFNRLKNLAVKNGGVYIAPSFDDFGGEGLADLAALVRSFRAASPGAAVILACGSMGSGICLAAANDGEMAAALSGLVLLGGIPDPALARSALVKRKVPIDFVHGSNDSVYPAESQRAVFDAIRAADKAYPTRFVMLTTGSHGAPIRMVDWKRVLSFMLAGR